MEIFKTLNGDEEVCQVHIADIHFGALSPSVQYQYLQQIISQLDEIEPKIIFLNGDLFHKSSYLAGSEPIYYAMKFIEQLVNYCLIKQASLVVLQGTLSHDGKQLRLFETYQGIKNLDMYIIKEAKVINVRDLIVTCIPEMYNMGEEYYRKFLMLPTHLTVVHGMLKEALPMAAINSKGLNDRAPIFCLQDFKNTKLVMAGHVHERTKSLNSKFIYCGSPYAWQFGTDGDEDKGFYVVRQNISNKEYSIEFRQINAPKYITINIDKCLYMGYDAKQIITYIEDKVQTLGNFNFYRIEVTTANNSNLHTIRILRDYYSNSKYRLKINQIDEFEENKTSFLEENKQYNFILDNDLTPYDKLAMYIRLNFDADISAKDIEIIIKND